MGKDPDNVPRIDVDIMASYVRELYDAILSEGNAATKMDTARRVVLRPAPVEEPIATPAPPPPAVVAPPPPPPPPPVVILPPMMVETPPPAPPEPIAPPVMITLKQEPTPAKTVAAAEGEFEVLFEEKQAKELSEKLSEMPIPDLRRAIALNDRLLLTRELFASDGQAFETTLAALNAYSQFADAKSYMINNCVIRYGWSEKKRVETAKDFIKLVRRRYK